MAINSDRRDGDTSSKSGAEHGPGSSADQAGIDALVASGSYTEAAELARKGGDFLRAAELYERIWEFGHAADCALRGGQLHRALANAIDARDEDQIAEIAGRLDDVGAGGQRMAMEVFAKKRRFADAAPRAEAVGAVDEAIEYYKHSHQELEAARLYQQTGRDRDAGRLLERYIELGPPGPEKAQAQLLLGLLLARRMNHEAAVRYLQEAARVEDTRREAERALIVELAAMGLRDAARDVLVEARSRDPDLPADIETFVRAERAAQRERGAPSTPGGGMRGHHRDLQVIAGRYRLDELIGAGGAGRVFRAHDEVRDRVCAVKLFHTGQARGNQAYERFIREAKLASALSHPNLVEVYDVSADQGYLVMELMTGGSLAERIADAPMSGPAVRRMALDIVAGLELAHQRGVIHRDVKPANIFFDARGNAKLGDFGIAHLLDLGQTQTGGLIGTLAYMSPEQITGSRLSIAADLYALGITLFEALTGRRPFLGPDFVAQHLGDIAPPPSEVGSGVAPGWDPVLARTLEKSPGDRYSSIDELRQAISSIDLGSSERPMILILPRADRARHPSTQTAEGKQRASRSDTGSGTGSDGSSASPGEPASRQREDAGDQATRDAEDSPRYQFETPIGKTEISSLSRAVDSILNRSVIIERYRERGEAEERRLYALARGGGPFVQRALAYDQASGIAVFEAPSGTLMSEAFTAAPPTPRQALRLLKRLARAVAPLHASQAAHGSLNGATVLVDEEANPTVLVCGLGRAETAAAKLPRAADDIAAIVALVAGALGVEPSLPAIAAALAPDMNPTERDRIMALAEPGSGEELYAFADAVEVAALAAWRRGRAGRGTSEV